MMPDPEHDDRARYLAVAQHKLNTPLSVLAGWSTLLQRWEHLEPDERTNGVEAIARAADDLRSQVDDLFAEARAHLLAQSLRPEPLALGPFVEDQVDAAPMDPDRQHVAVTVPAEISVRVDPDALRLVVAHLLRNATSYAPDGTVEISADEDGSRVVLRVADRGPGLPEDEDVFAPFRRGAGAARIVRGTGLGLHVVRSLVSAMGGEVRATNRPGGGALLEVVLDRA